MKAKPRRVALGAGPILFAALGILLSTAAFRCPGPEPMAGSSSGGTGSTSSTTTASSSSGCSPDLMTDVQNCGACGRACAMTNVAQVSCHAGVCDSTCKPGFYNLEKPAATSPDDGCEAHDHHVFVTSMGVTSDMNGKKGAAGGDAICQMVAMGAMLPGKWMAWLSDSATSPAMRFKKDGAPYVLLDGKVFAMSWADLTSGALMHPLDLQEDMNVAMPGMYVWTGTDPLGNLATPPNPVNMTMSVTNCMQWQSTTADGDYGVTGLIGALDPQWTAAPPPPGATASNCLSGVLNRLYCFQQ